MAKKVLVDCFLSIAGNDLTTYTKKVAVPIEVEEQDTTTYGSGGWHERLGGLKDGNLDVEFLQDYAAAAIDSILWPLLGTVVTFEVRPTQAAAGASNPKWTGSVLISKLEPVSGSVGDVATMGVSWPTSGAVTRAVA